jgi:hypothetical protein
MGFNRREQEDQRREAAEKKATERRATDTQVLEDAQRLIAAWNERQAKRMPMLFSPTIGAAIVRAMRTSWFMKTQKASFKFSMTGGTGTSTIVCL